MNLSDVSWCSRNFGYNKKLLQHLEDSNLKTINNFQTVRSIDSIIDSINDNIIHTECSVVFALHFFFASLHLQTASERLKLAQKLIDALSN